MTYAVDDEFGNQIEAKRPTYDAAVQSAKRYLAAHKDAPSVTIYTDSLEGGGSLGSWTVSREDVL